MLTDFVDERDVAAIWRPLTESESTTAKGLIAQAIMKLRVRAARSGIDLDAVIWGDELKMAVAKAAVANAVRRALRDIDGFSEKTVAIDDYRETNRKDPKLATGDLYIDENDLSGLLPRTRSKMGTLRLGSAL
jgi:hypothetical protein